MTPRAQRTLMVSGLAFALIGIVLVVSVRPARAQFVRSRGPGEAHFTTNIGSFKMLGFEKEGCSGHFVMTGQGSLLVTGTDGPPDVTGNFRLEASFPEQKKWVYHGQGKLVLDGKWTSVQWFGTDLTGDFKGRAKLRITGEFDKNLNTGLYWTTDPKKKTYWPANSSMDMFVPPYGVETNTQAPVGVNTGK